MPLTPDTADLMGSAPPLARLLALFRRSKPAPIARPIKARAGVDPTTIGRGFRDPGNRPGLKRIVVTVDDAQFERIRAGAEAREVSLASEVRRLIEAGFKSEETSK
jgi:hypothetical protein